VNEVIRASFEAGLAELAAKGLRRSIRAFSTPQAPRAVVDGRELLVLASNSYLGLSGDPRILDAGRAALARFGAGAGGSRLTTGGYEVHAALEAEVAALKRKGAALLYGTGYLANLGVVTALADSRWAVFTDKLNHASIIDGCRLSGAELVPYRHADPEDLDRKAARFAGRPGLLVTDGVFSMDGDVAPLAALAEVAHRRGLLSVLDDAHGSGVLGPEGAGSAAAAGAGLDTVAGWDVIVCTFGKAYACQGAAACAEPLIVEWLRNRSRPFVYSTALPPHDAAMALEAIRISRPDEARRAKLRADAGRLRARLREGGLEVPEGETPIVPVIVGAAETAVRVSARLLAEGVYVPAIRPPTVKPGTSRLRLSLMATHEEADLARAAEAVVRAVREEQR
jgi:8-amino-7-oxononanoate synthase